VKLESSFKQKKLPLKKRKSNFSTANILGRTFEEVLNIYDAFDQRLRPLLTRYLLVRKTSD
jgi:hypothetical protein